MFLCLFVGGGGGGGAQQQQQVPKGLEGEEDAEARVAYERRREKERRRDRSGKRKPVKGKDWILKKKEVCAHARFLAMLVDYSLSCSCIVNGEKKTSPTTQNIPDEGESPFSKASDYYVFLDTVLDVL